VVLYFPAKSVSKNRRIIQVLDRVRGNCHYTMVAWRLGSGIKQGSDFLVCSSSENSPATEPNWSFKSLGNSKRTLNAPTTFEWKITSQFCVFLTGGSGGPGGSCHIKFRAHGDVISMHKLTNASPAKLNWSFESLDNSKKLRLFPGRLNEKFRPNSVRSDWRM